MTELLLLPDPIIFFIFIFGRKYVIAISLFYMYVYMYTGQYPQINDDLVNSHHLLLCCIDMLYCIALVNRRRDLLNLECPFLPEDWASADYDPHDLPSILPQLCSKYNGK